MQSLHFRPLALFPKKSTLFCGTFTTKLALGCFAKSSSTNMTHVALSRPSTPPLKSLKNQKLGSFRKKCCAISRALNSLPDPELGSFRKRRDPLTPPGRMTRGSAELLVPPSPWPALFRHRVPNSTRSLKSLPNPRSALFGKKAG